MSTTPTRPTFQEVRKKAGELKNKIENKYPDVEVEYVDWVEFNGKNYPRWQARGFPPMRFGVHACVLIRGDQESTEEAASLADNEVARLLEETNVVIQVQRDNHVWCKKSVPLVASSVPAQKPTASYAHEDKRGIVFFCFFDDPHQHDWGRLSPQG